MKKELFTELLGNVESAIEHHNKQGKSSALQESEDLKKFQINYIYFGNHLIGYISASDRKDAVKRFKEKHPEEFENLDRAHIKDVIEIKEEKTMESLISIYSNFFKTKS